MYQQFSKKPCHFCRKKINEIDYKNTQVLNRFISSWSKIKAGKDTGTCTKHQRKLTLAIKHARFMALMPYVTR